MPEVLFETLIVNNATNLPAGGALCQPPDFEHLGCAGGERDVVDTEQRRRSALGLTSARPRRRAPIWAVPLGGPSAKAPTRSPSPCRSSAQECWSSSRPRPPRKSSAARSRPRASTTQMRNAASKFQDPGARGVMTCPATRRGEVCIGRRGAGEFPVLARPGDVSRSRCPTARSSARCRLRRAECRRHRPSSYELTEIVVVAYARGVRAARGMRGGGAGRRRRLPPGRQVLKPQLEAGPSRFASGTNVAWPAPPSRPVSTSE